MKIIWIHGFGEDSTVWEDFLPKLPAYYQHYTFDHALITKATDISDYALILREFIELHEITNPILIGHSMGGYIALEYAAIFPDEVSGLGLFHSSAAADSEDKKVERLKTAQFIQKNGSKAFIENFYPKMFSSPENYEELISRNIERYSLIPAESLSTATLAMRNRKDHINTLSTFKFPLFQILGKSDKFVPLELALQQTIQLQKPYTLVLNEAAHAGMIEQAPICAEFIRHFLHQL